MTDSGDGAATKIYFSDFFDIPRSLLEEYGAFNISLVNDLPLFVDPFLLFHSTDPQYQQLHEGIIQYLRFLRDKSGLQLMDPGLKKAWYYFKEVKQNWLGFSRVGNRGSALGQDFANSLHAGLQSIFRDFGEERIARGSHLEKLCLVAPGVGRDNISDFTTCLIKHFLLEYSQRFAQTYIHEKDRAYFTVPKARFNYETETWEHGRYELPRHSGDFVILTPKNMLTRDDIWISRKELLDDFEEIAAAVPDDELRAQLNNYLWSQLSNDPDLTAKDRAKEKRLVIERTISQYPAIIDYYIQDKEDSGDQAADLSGEKVEETQLLLVEQVRRFVNDRLARSGFYDHGGDTWDGALARVRIVKSVIEEQGGADYFYFDGKPITRQIDLELIYILAWRAGISKSRPSRATMGDLGGPLVKFKLASNLQLKRSLERHLNPTDEDTLERPVIVVVCCYTGQEIERVHSLLQELDLVGNQRVTIVDLRQNDKVSRRNALLEALESHTESARSFSLASAAPAWPSKGGEGVRGSRLLSDLRNAISQGNVFAVLGTGVSIHSTENEPAASWTGLLREGIKWCVDVNHADERWAARQLAAVDSGDLDELISVAQLITNKLGGINDAEYALWLRETVGALHVVQPDVLEALQTLGVHFATTNYDGLIEQVTGLRQVTWQDQARVFRVMRGDERAVLHFHGYWEVAETVVLGLSSYNETMKDSHAQGVLRSLPLTKSLLFVGFGEGLSDPNFKAFFESIRQSFAKSEYRHFRLARRHEVDEIQKMHPSGERLAVVSYGEDYGDLATFLHELHS